METATHNSATAVVAAEPTSVADNAAAPAPTALTPADGKAFMDVILYGESAGWDAGSKKSKVFLGHKKLMLDVLAARNFSVNNNGPLLSKENENKEAAAAAAEAPAEEKTPDTMAVVAPGIEEDEIKEVLIEAKRAFEAAEKIMSNGLVNCENWMELRDKYYHAGALFSLAGLPDDAARCLLQATFINRAFKDDDEALSSLTLAVNNIKLAHPGIATESLIRLSACYERNNLLFQAARCLKDAAEIFDGRLDDKPAAIDAYTAAIEMYHRVRNPYQLERTLVDQCHERLCFLHSVLGHYDVAERLFLEKAKNIPRNLPATRFYMYATLAVLARGYGSEEAYFDAIYDTKKVFDARQEMDRGFQKGKENELIRSVLKAFDENSLNQLDLAVDKYKSYTTTVPNAAFDLIVERCRQNLFEHLEHFA